MPWRHPPRTYLHQPRSRLRRRIQSRCSRRASTKRSRYRQPSQTRSLASFSFVSLPKSDLSSQRTTKPPKRLTAECVVGEIAARDGRYAVFRAPYFTLGHSEKAKLYGGALHVLFVLTNDYASKHQVNSSIHVSGLSSGKSALRRTAPPYHAEKAAFSPLDGSASRPARAFCDGLVPPCGPFAACACPCSPEPACAAALTRSPSP